MNDTTLIELSQTGPRLGVLGRTAREGVLARLAGLAEGRLHVREGGRTASFGPGGGIEAAINVHDPSFFADLAFGGSVGAAESYLRGGWSTGDLTALLRLMLRNLATLDGMEGGLAWLSAPVRRAAHWLRHNSRTGSRRNIAAHYDLGNDFFRLMLDESMMYSCAFFERAGMTLAEAQAAKLDRICRRLALGPGDHVLEIGTGWGGFAIHAASRYGCRVTTTTISPSQLELARERVQAAGLADRVTLLLEDYRDLDGRFDKLVSIEMIEAIGPGQYGEFFRRAAQRLAPRGRMMLQSITIADHRYARARRRRLHQALRVPGSLHSLGQRARRGHGGVIGPAHPRARGHRPALRDHARALAGQLPGQPGAGSRPRFPRDLRPSLGVLPLLLRGRLRRGSARRRAGPVRTIGLNESRRARSRANPLGLSSRCGHPPAAPRGVAYDGR